MRPIRAPGVRCFPVLGLLAMVLAACTTKPVQVPINPDRLDARGSDAPGRDPDYTPPDGAAEVGGSMCPPAPAVLKTAGADCDCDNECATGFCQDGVCCTGAACGKR